MFKTVRCVLKSWPRPPPQPLMCMHACMHEGTHARTHARTRARMHERMHACMLARTHARKHACIHACMHAWMHPCSEEWELQRKAPLNAPYVHSIYITISRLFLYIELTHVVRTVRCMSFVWVFVCVMSGIKSMARAGFSLCYVRALVCVVCGL